MGALAFMLTTTSKRSLSPLLPSIPFSFPSQRARDVNYWRSSLQEFFLQRSDQSCRQILIANACGSLQSPNIIFTDDYNRILRNSSVGFLTHESTDMKEVDLYADYANFTVRRKLEFNLLLENLREVEDALNGNELVILERDILTQIGRLGALKMFLDCLSRTMNEQTPIKSSQLTEHHDELFQSQSEKIVRSGKRDHRKWRRARALGTAANISSPSISAAEAFYPVDKVTACSLRFGRKGLAKNESELSIGVKEVANLEKIHERLEKQGFGPVSYARWAEAAGLDQKTLQQRLLYGWKCRDEVIKRARSLVIFIAKNYRGLGIPYVDLLQAGNVGVLNGAERFDGMRGYQFSTYVQYWIRKSILALISQHSRMIKIPAKLEKIIRQIQKARVVLLERQGCFPQDNEIADFVGTSLANVSLARKCAISVSSTEKETKTGWHMIKDKSIPTPDEQIIKQHIREDILKLLESLDSRERQILVLRYGFEDGRCRSLGEIGAILCLSREWIRQLHNNAFSKITKVEIQRELKSYMQFRSCIHCK